MPPKDKYTDPKLRDEVKEELHKGDKGGAPGQWSARKAQMMASEYKKRGGDYNTDKSEKDESQKHLENWGKEDWQTKEGSGNAKQEDGSQKRYLPKKAWQNMSEEEKKETDSKKQEQSKKGKQYVANTDKAKSSRKRAEQHEDDDDEEEQQEDGGNADADDDKENKNTRKSNRKQPNGKQAKQNNSVQKTKDEAEQQDEEEEGDNDDEDPQQDEEAQAGQKRGRKQSTESKKKQKSNADEGKPKNSKKTIGSKHMDAKEPGKKGSADRLPKKGQSVTWKAMPGYVEGKVEEVLKKDKQVDGKSVKASENDPKLVLKSNSSGKICVHKPDACFYD